MSKVCVCVCVNRRQHACASKCQHVGRALLRVHALVCVLVRKRAGFNVAHFDILYCPSSPRAHDFGSIPGFLLGAYVCYCTWVCVTCVRACLANVC